MIYLVTACPTPNCAACTLLSDYATPVCKACTTGYVLNPSGTCARELLRYLLLVVWLVTLVPICCRHVMLTLIGSLECPSNCNKCLWSGSAAVCTVHACTAGYAPDTSGNCAGLYALLAVYLSHFNVRRRRVNDVVAYSVLVCRCQPEHVLVQMVHNTWQVSGRVLRIWLRTGFRFNVPG